MKDAGENGNPFAIPDFWKSSSLGDVPPSLDDPIALSLEPLELDPDNDVDADIKKADDLYLPGLPELEQVAIEPVATLGTFSTFSIPESLEDLKELRDDVWSFPQSDDQTLASVNPSSGDVSPSSSNDETQRRYLVGENPYLFDAIPLTQRENLSHSADITRQTDSLLTSLLNLGLGWESVYYKFDDEMQTFYPTQAQGQRSGYDVNEVSNYASSFMIDSGNKIRRIWRLIRKVKSSTTSPPSLIALVASLSNILMTLQVRVRDSLKSIQSLSQLQSLFERPAVLLDCLMGLIERIDAVPTEEEILSQLYQIIRTSEHLTPWLQSLMLQIFERVSKPYLDNVSAWLFLGDGGGPETHSQPRIPGFVKCKNDTCNTERASESKAHSYEFEPASLPQFISIEDGQNMYDTGRSLRLLETDQPHHPLLQSSSGRLAAIKGIGLAFSTDGMQRLQARAKTYETELQEAIKHFNLHGEMNVIPKSKGNISNKCEDLTVKYLSAAQARAHIEASVSAFEVPLPEMSRRDCNQSSTIHESLYKYDASRVEPLSPIVTLSPVISAQSRLANRALLHLLFKEYRLRSQLSLLHQYSLFGDGTFASRLALALFDGEYARGSSSVGTSGLGLVSRRTWPPATSEIWVALMGILPSSYSPSSPSTATSSMSHHQLPENLSFAVREMSGDLLERCMNPDSVEALDFLKLEYKSSSPLDNVITPNVLADYDTIFRLLLRSLRMAFVVNHLFQDLQGKFRRCAKIDSLDAFFRIQTHHFVTTICTYLWEVIQLHWSKLEERLESLEDGLDDETTEGVSSLRDFHERVLKQMIFSVMLCTQQSQIMNLLEEIFGLVLQFARLIRLRSEPFAVASEDAGEGGLPELHAKFHKKVHLFIRVCRESTEREVKDEMVENRENILTHLLLKLEFNGFYKERE